jgi:hypothetical protein
MHGVRQKGCNDGKGGYDDNGQDGRHPKRPDASNAMFCKNSILNKRFTNFSF